MADPAPQLGPIPFALVGPRSYVRATDVLAAMLTFLPDQPLTLTFRHPLPGPAILRTPLGRLADISFRLKPKS